MPQAPVALHASRTGKPASTRALLLIEQFRTALQDELQSRTPRQRQETIWHLAPVLLGGDRDKLVAHSLDLRGVDPYLLLSVTDEQGQIAKPVDPPRIAAGQLVERAERLAGEDFARRAGRLHAVVHVADGLFQVQRP